MLTNRDVIQAETVARRAKLCKTDRVGRMDSACDLVRRELNLVYKILVEIRLMQLNNAIKTMGLALFLALTGVTGPGSYDANFVSEAQAATVSSISVRGNQRIDDEIIASYLTIEPGRSFNNFDIDDSVKALFATGLFNDVSVYQQGRVLVVEVDENSTVNRVFFEGNNRIKDEGLEAAVRLRAQGVYSDEQAAADVDLIRQAYSRVGRRDADVSYEVVPLANNRVNVIYRVDEGGKTKIAEINFVGNDTFHARRLHDVISTKESTILSFLSSNDVFDQNRINADEERLRRFYFNKGFADFQIISTDAQLDEINNEYIITFTIEEGARYTFGNVGIESTIYGIDEGSLVPYLESVSGDYYSAKDVEDTVLAITERVAETGFAFVDVVPRGSRNFDTNTIDVTYLVDEGARVFIEDIQIIGNDRTRDYVIRREFDLSEGDAYNRVLINKTRDRIERLGFFESVAIATRPGSQPDKIIVIVNVKDRSTGDISLSGGFSSSNGVSADVSFTERNFLGRGQYFKIGGRFGEKDTSYVFNFTEPYFLGYRVSAGVALESRTTDDIDERRYAVDSTTGSLTFGFPITEDLKTSVFYSYRDSQIEANSSLIDPNPASQGDSSSELSAALAGGLGDFLASGIGYSVTYNTFDNPKSPREGINASFTQTFYGVGGDAQYLATEAKISGYYTVLEEEDWVLYGRLRGGHVEIFGDDDGSNFRTLDNFQATTGTIRGFETFGYGPRDPITDDPLGGRTYWNATAEVQFPMPYLSRSFGLRGAFFADIGQLTDVGQDAINRFTAVNGPDTTGQVDDDALRASIGASILWQSPFGPLRVDYAVPILKESYDNKKEFNFGISRDF